MADAIREATIRFHEEVLPPGHASHGTGDTMVRRTLAFELPAGKATLEQTDYGHPGRFNPWEPRGIDSKLRPQMAALVAVGEAIDALVA